MILLAPDKFKSTFSAAQIAKMQHNAIRRLCPALELIQMPLADGGEGSGELLAAHFDAQKVHCIVRDPKGRMVKSMFWYTADKSLAIIESAKAVGLELLTENEYNPLSASSAGLGDLIVHGMEVGAKTLIVTLGGSATVDCGAGMLQALGVKFNGLPSTEHVVTASDLNKICSIVLPEGGITANKVNIIALADVENPLCGSSGSVMKFASQKGAKEPDLPSMEENICRFARLSGMTEDQIFSARYYGAAGGLGAAFRHFLNAELISGADYILDMSDFTTKLNHCELLVIGEGALDAESFSGKLPGRLYHLAHNRGIPVAAICGVNRLKENELPPGLSVFPLFKTHANHSEIINDTPERMEKAVFSLLKQFQLL